MKRTFLTSSIIVASVFSSSAFAISTKDITVPEATYPTLEHFNKHVQGSLNEDRRRIKTLEGITEENGNRITEVEEWTSRQEGAFSAGLRDSVDRDKVLTEAIREEQEARKGVEESLGDYAFEDYGSYEKHFGGQKGVNAHLEGSIGDIRDVNDHQYKYLNGLKEDDKVIRGRLDGVESKNTQQDVVIGRVESESKTRDESLYNDIQTVNEDSVNRDDALSGRIDDRVAYDGVQDEYARDTRQHIQNVQNWNVDQFNQHATAIQSNTQAINTERHERQEADKDLQAGISSAIAAGSHIMDANYQGFQMSVAGGAYRGASAVSLAVGGAFNDRTFGHINVSNDSRGHQAIGGNVNFKF